MEEYATIRDAIREWKYVVGAENPEVEWLVSPYDTWEINPYYTGPKTICPEFRHEDD